MLDVVAVPGISIQFAPSVLYCHTMPTVPLPPLPDALNVTVPVPLHPVWLEGLPPRLIGAPTCSTVSLVVTDPQLFV